MLLDGVVIRLEKSKDYPEALLLTANKQVGNGMYEYSKLFFPVEGETVEDDLVSGASLFFSDVIVSLTKRLQQQGNP